MCMFIRASLHAVHACLQGTYLLESKLKERGAMYVGTAQDWTYYYYRPHVVRHGRLVTGQK